MYFNASLIKTGYKIRTLMTFKDVDTIAKGHVIFNI